MQKRLDMRSSPLFYFLSSIRPIPIIRESVKLCEILTLDWKIDYVMSNCSLCCAVSDGRNPGVVHSQTAVCRWKGEMNILVVTGSLVAPKFTYLYLNVE